MIGETDTIVAFSDAKNKTRTFCGGTAFLKIINETNNNLEIALEKKEKEVLG